jgi:hypothetical protein
VVVLDLKHYRGPVW